MARGFRIQSLTLEGFKGFTNYQEIDFQGRHVFLLGKNGNGKSSVLEALRWGLFGSTGRPNEIVAHQGYGGRCRVEIGLIRDGEPWNLRRTLLRGVTGGSDPVLADSRGREQSIRETMPQLETLDAGEGTHIIFAPQSIPLSRRPEDLSAFERTVFSYLGLTSPRILLSHLQTFIGHQELIEKDWGGKITDARTKLDNQIKEYTTQRGRILGSAPWMSDHPPSVSESEQKVKRFIENTSSGSLPEELTGASLSALIDHAEDALKGRWSLDQNSLKEKSSHLDERLGQLESLLDIQKGIETHQASLANTRLNLDNLLEHSSLDELRLAVEREKTNTHNLILKKQIAVRAASLLDRDPADPVYCPICASEHPRAELKVILDSLIKLPADSTSDLAEIESRLEKAEGLTLDIQRLEEQLNRFRGRVTEHYPNIHAEDAEKLGDDISSSRIQASIDDLGGQKDLITRQQADKENWHQQKQTELSSLKQEGRFHGIQRDLSLLEESTHRLQRAEKAYSNLVGFGESVRAIHSEVNKCLIERLEEEAPSVAQNLTGVFATLARHPWYDRLLIDKSKLPKLELQVASSQDVSEVGHPTGVLNGQAESALALVPYFAFSQEDHAPTEVYLVMLDDPTRAFDNEHIEILVERLATLGRNVQLIVASQETDRLGELLPKYFESQEYVVVEPRDWSYTDGPLLDIKY